jgi:hypothetical protein
METPSRRPTMSSTSEVISFPKTPKPKPEAEKPKLPAWQQTAAWILNLARKHPEIDQLLGDRTRLFLFQRRRWPSPPTERQAAWLESVADMVEWKLAQIKAREEAEKTPPPPTPAA